MIPIDRTIHSLNIGMYIRSSLKVYTRRITNEKNPKRKNKEKNISP